MLRKSRCWISLLVFWGIMLTGIMAAPGLAAADSAWVGDWITIGSGMPTVSGDTPIADPSGIAVDSSGNVYVADKYGCVILKKSYDSEVWIAIPNSPFQENNDKPWAVAVDAYGNVYVVNSIKWNSGIVWKYNGAIWTDITHNEIFDEPSGIAVDSLCNVYVTDTYNGRVMKLPNGSSTWQTIGDNTPQNGNFDFPVGITVDNSSNLYVTDYRDETCSTYGYLRFLEKGNTTWGSKYFNGQSLLQPSSVAVDKFNNIYVANTKAKQIYVNLSGRDYWAYIDKDNDFNSPYGVAVDSYGNVYVTDQKGYWDNKIYKHQAWATQLVWTTQPGGAPSGNNLYPQPTVELKDGNGITVSAGNSDSITTTLTDPQGSTLGGASTIQLSNGVAAYHDLNVSNAGTYTLTATVNIASKNVTYFGKNESGYTNFYDLPPAPMTCQSNSFTIASPPKAATPTASPVSGTAVPNNTSVNLSTVTVGATIYYTTNGSDPNSNSPSGTGVVLTGAPGSTVTVKAMAAGLGWSNSDIATFTYIIQHPGVAVPTGNPPAGIYSGAQDVELKTDTTGATIYYTTDGTDPTISSTEYTSAIEVTSDMIIKAIAVKDGMENSPVATFEYIIVVFAGGDGSLANPYQVATPEHLDNVRKCLNEHFIQTADIDLSSYNTDGGWVPIGNSGSLFSGTFNGNGKTISNLTINRSTENYVGLFGFIGTTAKIQNVKLENNNINGQQRTGALVGENQGTITNSYATGAVTGTGTYVGGLVGYNGDTISGSYTTGTVNGQQCTGGLVGDNNKGTITLSYSTSTVKGKGGVAGLAGSNSYGTITNSYARGGATGTEDHIGGLVGWNFDGKISYSYATGAVAGRNFVGGLVGKEGTAQKSYWDITTSGTDSSVGGVSKTTAEMKLQETYVDWDFTGIWGIDGIRNNGYPFLTNNPPDPDTANNATINPTTAVFNKEAGAQADVTTTITWNNANLVTDIKKAGISIGADNYTVTGNTLTIKKGYLATQETGNLVLSVEFDQGNVATLTITISDTMSPNPTITSITAVNNVEVDYGTVEAAAIAALAATTTITDSNNVTHTVNLSWSMVDYDGNTAGNYTATGTFALPAGVDQSDPETELKVTATVTVNAEVSTDKTLVSITAPSAITGVANGTAKTAKALGLPIKVTLVTSDGDVEADVIWDVATCSYDPAVTTEQTFTVSGNITLPTGVVNPNSVKLTTSITVTVNAQAVEPNPTITSITAVSNVEVDYGTVEAAAIAALAATTTITDSNNVTHSVILSWSIADYDGNTAGNYTATGTFVLPAGVDQSDPVTELKVTATVTVNAEVSTDRLASLHLLP